MADFLDYGGERAKQVRRADTLARLRSVEPGAAARLVAAASVEPDPSKINLRLLCEFFEQRAAARAARLGERVESVFRAFYRLPGHLRPKAEKMLLASVARPARRSFLNRLFGRRSA